MTDIILQSGVNSREIQVDTLLQKVLGHPDGTSVLRGRIVLRPSAAGCEVGGFRIEAAAATPSGVLEIGANDHHLHDLDVDGRGLGTASYHSGLMLSGDWTKTPAAPGQGGVWERVKIGNIGQWPSKPFHNHAVYAARWKGIRARDCEIWGTQGGYGLHCFGGAVSDNEWRSTWFHDCWAAATFYGTQITNNRLFYTKFERCGPGNVAACVYQGSGASGNQASGLVAGHIGSFPDFYGITLAASRYPEAAPPPPPPPTDQLAECQKELAGVTAERDALLLDIKNLKDRINASGVALGYPPLYPGTS